MNIKLILQPFNFDIDEVWWGCTFSQFMIMLPNALQFDNIDNLYFEVLYPTKSAVRKGDFNSVFDQYCDDTFIPVICTYYGNYTNDKIEGLGPIEKGKDFEKLKLICSKIRFKKDLIDYVNAFAEKNINNSLGVHVRTGDMNFYVPEYGIYHTSDYIARIKDILAQESLYNIFIASDNEESIEKISQEFPQATYVDELIRERYEGFETPIAHQPYIPRIWEEGFKEMLLLSRCSQLLCRISNVANSSLLFSNTITKVHRL
jgi:hypothetical protein